MPDQLTKSALNQRAEGDEMTDHANYAYATDAEGRWTPIDVETERDAAIEAAYGHDHEYTEEHGLTVLVGEPTWYDADDFAELFNTELVIDMLDEKIYDEFGGDVPQVREYADDETLDRFKVKFRDELTHLISYLMWHEGYPSSFKITDWTTWRVTTPANDESGPDVKKVEDHD